MSSFFGRSNIPEIRLQQIAPADNDSSLLVDDAIVNDFTTRHNVPLDTLNGKLAIERKALLRYLAEIDFRRQAHSQDVVDNLLVEELIDQMMDRLTQDIHSGQFYEYEVDETTGYIRLRAIESDIKRIRLEEADSLVITDSEKSCFERISGFGIKVADPEELDVPLSQIVSTPWRPTTLRAMMACDKDELKVALENIKREGDIKLHKIEGLDVYFVEAGNHRILGSQWAGEETIKATVTTVRLDLENLKIKGDCLVVTFDSSLGDKREMYSPMTKVENKIAVELGIPGAYRDFGLVP